MEKRHKLRVCPDHYKATIKGIRTFVVARKERGFKVNDKVLLREYVESWGYTGKSIEKTIIYIMDGGLYGIDKDYCILGIR